MPKRQELERVLVIGSGPIIIGQAAEFDYSGTQALQAIREEGLQVILVNPNPATIMTDAQMADRTYLEPLTPEFVERIIAQERPQGLLPTLGGQIGLNLATQLSEAGVLQKYGVELIGTPLQAIRQAEDRGAFKELMRSIGEPVLESAIVTSVSEALSFAEQIGFPVIVRPAYTLGGTGGGFARNAKELAEIVNRALKLSPIGQCLIEQSVFGWKEIEYEVLRDSAGNAIAVCNMENIDPVGVHTGDSIVVAPSQTLTDREYQMLRSSALKIIHALGIQGGCNVQFALNPRSRDYVVIEVNPRVSRSSALASKATGYPIAKIAAKIAIGLTLDEIKNPVTGTTYAAFEPALDYVAVKIPRFPFEKFSGISRTLGTQMQATGEVMAIDRTFPGALQKAIRSLEIGRDGLRHPDIQKAPDKALEQKIATPNDERLFAIAEALRRGWEWKVISQLSHIDKFFIQEIGQIVEMERRLAQAGYDGLTRSLLREAKRLGFSDATIGQLVGKDALAIRRLRKSLDVRPVYKMVDTCAAEFEATTPYYYSAYDGENEAKPPLGPKAIVLGSGPIRIGQGIEFDYSAVHAAWALREEGIQSVMINNNPETVSTDFNTSDRLYFEPLTVEDVLNVIEQEGGEWTDKHDIAGVVAQFGGQTAIHLSGPLAKAGVPLLGTPVEEVDRGEDREKFDKLLAELGISRPPGGAAVTVDEAVRIADRIGYPVLVRPSYVLGGRAMEIVYREEELRAYMATAVEVSETRPVLVDKYLPGKEIEVDAVSDGRQVLIGGILEHIERAGVHSGDSIAVYPATDVHREIREQVLDYTTRLALALSVKGLINVQYVVHGGKVYVLEVNPRASRTVPFLAKAAGIPLAHMATRIAVGRTLEELGYRPGPGSPVVRHQVNLPSGQRIEGYGWIWPEPNRVSVKVPVFSWQKLGGVDVTLSPEMKSTGEVMGTDRDVARALYKALLAAGYRVPRKGTALISVAEHDQDEILPLAAALSALGFRILASGAAAKALEAVKIPHTPIHTISEGSPRILDLLRNGDIHLVISTLARHDRGEDPDGFLIRRTAVEHNVLCLVNLDTARAVVQMLETISQETPLDVSALQDWHSPVSQV
ncbi:carbamoyl-phosphate synthase large subunit [Hydrogenibacillus schlegelii]|uniref:Carbamoyl phosphate synthase large chain n=1 Tax=Hydrogenibacillus schlegelii TaxID=1484 RepID=A0A132N022_HYDSH|nr:carbamoyl-phosphate synthase large subunit [Hydrogenibacillus schlegelii]KWX03280.1 carbamoyl phosphate synthase large subunit [Hydrogenibacillus schlegelii]OAR04371.1 carbamoyl phosphate synthase large subunit [Hydrogenibacillus schlegelii]